MLSWFRRSRPASVQQRERQVEQMPDSHAILFGPSEAPDASGPKGKGPGDCLGADATGMPDGGFFENTATVPPPEKIVTSAPDDVQFRTPNDLAATALKFNRALIIGSCFSEILGVYLGHAFKGVQID